MTLAYQDNILVHKNTLTRGVAEMGDCTKLHSLIDCDSKCENDDTCPFRHR